MERSGVAVLRACLLERVEIETGGVSTAPRAVDPPTSRPPAS